MHLSLPILYLIANIALFLASSALIHKLVPAKHLPGSIALLGSLVLYLAHITLITLLLGVVAGRLNIITITMVLVVYSLALSILLRGHLAPAIRQPVRQAIGALGAMDAWGKVALALILLTGTSLITKIYLLPLSTWDVFVYHMTPAVEWFQQERIPSQLDTPMSGMNIAALGMSLLNYWVFLFTQSDLLLGLPQTLFSLILALTTYAFVRHGTGNPSLAIKFAAISLTLPFVLMQATTAKDHIALNTSLFTGCLFLWWALKRGEPRVLIPAGCAFGLMLGFKMGAIIHLLVAGVVFVSFLWSGRKADKSLLHDKRGLINAGLVACALIIALGSFWYLRTIVASGTFSAPYVAGTQAASPLMPAAHEYSGPAHPHIMQAVGKPREPIQSEGRQYAPVEFLHRLGALISTDKFKQHMQALIPSLFDYRGLYNVDLNDISGFGPQFALFGLPAMAFCLFQLTTRRILQDQRNLPALTAIVLLLVYGFIYPWYPHSYRLFSFLAFLLIPHAAYLIHRFGLLEMRFVPNTLNLTVTVCIFWGLATSTLPLRGANPLLLREFIFLPDEYRSSARYTSYFAYHHPNMYWLLQSIPGDEPIALLHGGRIYDTNIDLEPNQIWTYPLYDPHWKRKILYLRHSDYLSCDGSGKCKAKPALAARLKQSGISFVTTCRNIGCFGIDDPAYSELAPGFYYFEIDPDRRMAHPDKDRRLQIESPPNPRFYSPNRVNGSIRPLLAGSG